MFYVLPDASGRESMETGLRERRSEDAQSIFDKTPVGQIRLIL